MSKVLTPILFFLAAIGLFFTYLSPAYDVLLAFQEQEVRLDQSLEQSKQLLVGYDGLLRDYNSITSDDLKKLSQILPDDIDAVRLIMDLDALTTKHRLSVRSFKVPQMDAGTSRVTAVNAVATPEENDPVGKAVLTIECDGKYEDFKALLSDIERSLTLMDVVGLELKVADMTKPNAVNTTVYTLELQTYWLK